MDFFEPHPPPSAVPLPGGGRQGAEIPLLQGGVYVRHWQDPDDSVGCFLFARGGRAADGLRRGVPDGDDFGGAFEGKTSCGRGEKGLSKMTKLVKFENDL